MTIFISGNLGGESNTIHGYDIPDVPTEGLPKTLSSVNGTNFVKESQTLSTTPWSSFRETWDDTITEISEFTGEAFRGLNKAIGDSSYLQLAQNSIARPATGDEYWTLGIKAASTVVNKYLKINLTHGDEFVIDMTDGTVTTAPSDVDIDYDAVKGILKLHIAKVDSTGSPGITIYLASDSAGINTGFAGTGINDMLVSGVQLSPYPDQPYVKTTTAQVTDGETQLAWV